MKTKSAQSITATGSTNAVSLTLDPKGPDSSVMIGLSGTYTTLVAAIEVQFVGSTVWYKRQSRDAATGLLNNGTVSPSDSTANSQFVDVRGCTAIRVYAVSGTPTALLVDFVSGSIVDFGGPMTNQPIVNTGAGTFAGLLTTNTPTDGLGYATGAGGAVTQASSRTTGVTLSKVCGAITLVSAAGSATPATFTVTNTVVEATDTIVLSQKSGTDLLELFVTNVGAGSFKITFFTTGGTTTEQPVINFAVIKAKAA